MDLQSALRASGPKWQIARVGALLFLVLACGLLIASLLSPAKAGPTSLGVPPVTSE